MVAEDVCGLELLRVMYLAVAVPELLEHVTEVDDPAVDLHVDRHLFKFVA